jgi:PKD repeat protein
MKTTQYLIGTLTLVLWLTACKPNKPDHNPFLNLDKNSSTRSAEENKDTIIVTSNVSWKVANLPEWLTSSAYGGVPGDKLILSFKKNPSMTARSADITVSVQGIAPATIHVTQNGNGPFISVNGTNWNEDPSAHSDSIPLSTNNNWNLSLPAGVNWITLRKAAGTESDTWLKFAIAQNTTGQPRSAVLTLASSNSTLNPIQITINQVTKPVASFDTSVITRYAPAAYSATNTSQFATEAIWDLGNGQLSTNQNVVAVYNTPGSYQLKLVVRNANGIADTAKVTINVNQDPALLGYFPLNGDEKDNSYHNNDLRAAYVSYTGADRKGNFNKAGSFSGNSSLTFPQGLFSQNANFTCSFWIKPAAMTSGQVLLGLQNSALIATPAEFDPAIYIGTDGRLYGHLNDGTNNTSSVALASLATKNGWVHVVLSRQGNTQQFYVNGELLNSSTGNIQLPANAFLGTGYADATIPGNFSNAAYYGFTGQMDDVRFYNKALSLAEIQSLFSE